MDCLLLHVPKFNHTYGPFGRAMFINFMAGGLLSIASELKRVGCSTQVLHLGIEHLADPAFDLAAYLEKSRPKVIGLSLNWHHQCVDTLAAARVVKRALPDSFVVLGGFTAGSFAKEILEGFDSVDGVVRGEGERPMRQIVRAACGLTPFAGVENLCWRDGGRIVENRVSWHATDDDLSSFDFGDFSLLGRARDYPHLFAYMFPPERTWLNRLMLEWKRSASFLLPLGRGCLNRCAWCGGGVDATTKLLGRKAISHMSADAAADLAMRAAGFGFTSVATDFNGPGVEAVIRGMLGVCRAKGFKPRLTMEAWSLPGADFIEEFAASAAPGSAIEFSPDFPLEDERHFYKGYQFTNEELFATLDRMHRLGVTAGLHFLYGLPSRCRDEKRVAEVMERLHAHPAVERLQHHPCELEPMAPLYLQPERYGIIRKVSTLADFMKMHSSGELRMGFERPDASEEELLRLRCKHACIVGKWGRQKCALARMATDHPVLDPVIYAAGKAVCALGQDNALARKLWPGAK